MPDMTPLGWLLLVAGVLAVWRGFRPCYDGVYPRAWWRNERDLRTRGRILRRLGRVLVAAALLTGAGVAGVAMVALVVIAAVTTVGVALAWYGLRVASNWAEPHMTPLDYAVVGQDAGYRDDEEPNEQGDQMPQIGGEVPIQTTNPLEIA